MAWWLPLRTEWSGYNERELANQAQKRRLDRVVVPAFAAWYVLLASIVTEHDATRQIALVEPHSPIIPGFQFVLAAVAVYIFMVQTVANIDPQESREAYKAQVGIGRWIYLSRHILALQAWHQVFSCASARYPWLTGKTHGVSIFIATLAWFHTIQYFTVVHSNSIFKH